MKILITGAPGLVGSQLIETLFLRGHDDINILTRNKERALKNSVFPIKAFTWNIEENLIEENALTNVDVVIHLAGENIASGRWTKEKKLRILNSRVKSTRLLLETIKKQPVPPKKFICASAVGIYGDRKDEELTRNSSLGDDFLANVCKQWEKSAHDHDIPSMKTYSLRTGVVLSKKGGALQKMLPAFKLGVAGKLGNGSQYISWIHIDDLVGQYIFLLENEVEFAVLNAVSPKPVTNYIFTKILGKELGRPTIIPVPKFMLNLLFGEMSSILLGSQNVIPTRFMELEYPYKFRNLQDALRNILNDGKKNPRNVLKKLLSSGANG